MISLSLLAVMATGCATMVPATDDAPLSLREVNERLDGQLARLQMVGARNSVRGREVHVRPDSTVWNDWISGERYSVPTAHVTQIWIRPKSGRGVFRVLVGTLGGCTAGATVAIAPHARGALRCRGYSCLGAAILMVRGCMIGTGLGFAGGLGAAVLDPAERVVVYAAPHAH
ncbi:MAG: hypothetical protein AAGI71_18355 [Bacteroidota bacterium]